MCTYRNAHSHQNRGEPMFKSSRLPIPIVKGRYLQIIGRLIGKTDGYFFITADAQHLKECDDKLILR